MATAAKTTTSRRAVVRAAGNGVRSPRAAGQVGKPILLFALPALVLYAFVLLVPTLRGAVYAFTDWDGLSQTFNFVGFDNFIAIFQSSDSVRAIINTLLIAAVTTISANLLGLLLALGVNSKIKSRNVLRVFLFAPAVLTPVVTAYLFKFIFAPTGPLNGLLAAVHLNGLQQDWLGDPHWALVSIMVVVIWQQAGYAMVIYLAGLQGVPQELLEAASVDGAQRWRRFWSVTRPLLAPAITISMMLILIHGLKIFAEVWVMTSGGPGNSTHSLSTLIYKNAFQFGLFGTSIAMALILLVLVAVVSGLQYRSLLSQEGHK